MTSLRDELARKALLEKNFHEQADRWIKDNIILISEKLNRTAVTRLTNSILKFDEKFGPFKSKLPEIQEIISSAETGLQLVLTGKTSDSRAADMLRKLSMVYSVLSEFFSSDLPALLRTPLFRVAKANPDMRLDSISDPSHDVKSIAAAFSNALRPTKEEALALGRIYKSIPMPNIKADTIAAQLLGMSFRELSEISTMEKVPELSMERSPKDGEMQAWLGTDHLPQQVSDIPVAALEESEELDEQNKQPPKDNIAEIGKSLTQLSGLVAAVPELSNSPIKGAVDKLRQEAQKAISGGRLGALMRNGPTAVFRDPQGKVLAQAQMTIDLFKKLGAAWPKLQPLFADDSFTPEEQAEVGKILKAELQGGLLARLKNVFAVAPFPGLGAEDIIKVVTDIAARTAQVKQTGTAVSGQVTESVVREDLQDLQKFFTSLNTSFKPQKSWMDSLISSGAQAQQAGTAPAQTAGRTGTAPSAGTAPTQPQGTAEVPGQPASTTPTGGTGPASRDAGQQQAQQGIIELGPSTSDEQLKAITRATGVEEDRLRKLAQTRGVRVTIDSKNLLR